MSQLRPPARSIHCLLYQYSASQSAYLNPRRDTTGALQGSSESATTATTATTANLSPNIFLRASRRLAHNQPPSPSVCIIGRGFFLVSTASQLYIYQDLKASCCCLFSSSSPPIRHQEQHFLFSFACILGNPRKANTARSLLGPHSNDDPFLFCLARYIPARLTAQPSSATTDEKEKSKRALTHPRRP